ncbi:MAG: Ribonuclease I precursor (EC [uncultured Sulfurovum sp.]|uniref:Ribonuclease I (EC) n=1 Tax=uncultured Sulfurovum sp. TaxID=269237 RepID=A0A6S6TGE5_9BACT|nr:MAG: Ribonuclease I precursor (EC [uncultured Sulfurovum sp.]
MNQLLLGIFLFYAIFTFLKYNIKNIRIKMNKIITASLMVSLPLLILAKNPKVYETAVLECPAYNNLKHTANSNDIQLEMGKKYRVLQRNKGQVLTLIEGQRVAQRWVKEVCLSDGKKKVTAPSIPVKSTSKSTSKQNLLAISWQNAFCQTHQYKKECKSMNANSFGAFEFVLHGLWPQPRNNAYCNVSKKQVGMDKNKQWYSLDKLDLTSSTRTKLSQLMPGYASNLHRHEWIKHGTCYGTSANDYYVDAMNLLTQVNESKVQQYFKENVGRMVNLKEIRKQFDQEFGIGAGEHVTMNCRKGLVTELWLHLGNGSSELKELFKSGERAKSRCYKGQVDAVGF